MSAVLCFPCAEVSFSHRCGRVKPWHVNHSLMFLRYCTSRWSLITSGSGTGEDRRAGVFWLAAWYYRYVCILLAFFSLIAGCSVIRQVRVLIPMTYPNNGSCTSDSRGWQQLETPLFIQNDRTCQIRCVSNAPLPIDCSIMM